MFRPAILLIGIVIGLGPSAGLLCKALCAPEAAALEGCHTPHDMTTASLQEARDCGTASARLTTMPSEGPQRGGVNDIAPATVNTAALLPAPDPLYRTRRAAAPDRQIDRCPIVSALRI